MNTRPVSSLPTGTALARYLQVLGASRGDSGTALLLAERFRDSPTVHATLDLQTKGAVAPGSTSDATWAGPLAQFGIAAEALQLLRGASILGALENKIRRVPFRVSVVRETGAGVSGSWVGEAAPVPVSATAFDVLSQPSYKVSAIVALSRELLTLGDRAAERTVTATTIAGEAAYLDAQFLTPSVTLSAGIRPAAITNGATAVTSTGTTAAQINVDLAALLAAITTPGGSLVWVMRAVTAARIAATIGGTAAADIPRTLFGIPLILSANSPQQITLLDASEILYSDDGGIDIATSEQASLHMDSTPADPTVAGTVLVSLWTASLWAVKITCWIAYLRAQAGAVSYMSVSY